MTTSTPDQRYLAALIDGEPGPGGFEVAIDAVQKDAELRARFERGLLIGQVLRGEPTMLAARSVSARVAGALASEPVVMRPGARRARRRTVPINRAAVGLAIAASAVTLAVLVGTGPLPEDLGSGAPAQPLVEAEAASDSMPAEQVAERWAMDEPAGSTALDALLVDHRERASASALTGFIPYAAVVGPSGLR